MVSYFEKYRGIDQAVFWLFIFLFVFDYHMYDDNWGVAFQLTFIETLSYAVIAYLNYAFLLPLFFQKKQYVLFVLGIVGVYALYIFFIRGTGLEDQFYEAAYWRNNFSMMLNVSLFLLLSTLYWYYQQWHQEREQQLQLKSEKLEAELKFLKTQISPHFIFNSLNNIYTLALQKHDNAAPMIAKLSKIMRYLLYDCSQPQVALEKEVETIQHYLDLHLMRKTKSQNVDFYQEGRFRDLTIAPLLLINFVENCFKHSNIDRDSGAWIRISCALENDGTLIFTTENSKDFSAVKHKHSAIGLINTQRQLELLYPDRHTLTIENQKDIFKVNLSIQLQPKAITV